MRPVLRHARASTEAFRGQLDAVRAAQIGPPPESRAGRFAYGLALPFVLLRLVLRDPHARRFYLRVASAQAVVTLSVALAINGASLSGHGGGEGASNSAAPSHHEARGRRRAEGKRTKVEAKRIGELVRRAVASADGGARPSVREVFERLRADAGDDDGDASDEADRDASARVDAGDDRGARVDAGHAAVAGEVGDDDEDDDEDDDDDEDEDEDAKAGPSRKDARLAARLAVFYGTLCTLQWIVIGLSRDFRDRTVHTAAVLGAIEPEDPPNPRPRLRLEWRWLKKRVRDRLRGLVAFVSAAPLIGLLSAFLPGGHYVDVALTAVWGAYWVVVFTAAKCGRAWRPHAPEVPIFLRACDRLAARARWLRWAIVPWRNVWNGLTVLVHAPAVAAERAPWELAGLGLVRLLGGVPVVGYFFSPFVPVAAGHVLALSEETRTARSETPPTSSSPSSNR